MSAEVRPPIVVADEEKNRLDRLARASLERLPDVADELLFELERADVCASPSLPPDTVRMNSVVEFETDSGSHLIMRLVYPEDADIAAGRMSILTPIGTALIGLSVGQSMNWTDRSGRSRTLHIKAVSTPHAKRG